MVGDSSLGCYNASFVQAHSKAIRPNSYCHGLGEITMKPVICPVCHKGVQVASISMYLYVHYCEITQTTWFTNNLIWSTDHTQVTGVSRGPRNDNTGN